MIIVNQAILVKDKIKKEIKQKKEIVERVFINFNSKNIKIREYLKSIKL